MDAKRRLLSLALGASLALLAAEAAGCRSGLPKFSLRGDKHHHAPATEESIASDEHAPQTGMDQAGTETPIEKAFDATLLSNDGWFEVVEPAFAERRDSYRR